MREYRILHLEDSHSDADMIKRLLLKGNLNFQYFFAEDKESFIRGLTDFKPDVILCDHALPQFDSVMAFDIYKEMKLEIPFILVTGSVSEEYAVEMIKKGIDDYLLKTNLQRLPQAIKSAFDKRENEKKIRQVEKYLRQSETNLRTIFENTSSGFLLLDKNLNVVSYNNQMNYFAKKSFGFDLQQNVNLIAMFMPERQQEFKNLFNMILKGEAISNETSYPQTDGKFIWYNVKGNPVLNQERNIAGVCLTIDNITERKNAEEKLWESEAHLAEAQRLAKMGSWNFDLKIDRLTWSKELYNIFGTDKQTFRETHGSFLHLIDAGDREFALQTSRHTQQTGEPFTIEYHITTRKGEKRIIQEFGYGVKDENGIVTRLFGTAQDITERKLAEEDRLRLSSILEATSDFVGIADVDQRIVFLNTAGRKAMGYGEMEDLSQKKILDFSPDWANEIIGKEGIPAALKAGKWIGETAFLTRGGVEIPVSQVIVAHNNSNGELQYLSTIARDITFQKEAEQKLEQQNKELVFQNEEKEKRAEELANANKELALSNTELEQFAYIASHDLQEPLRMVTSFMNLLENRIGGQLDDTNKKYIHFAVDGAMRMKILIQDLLQYSRVGTNQESFTATNLNEVMQYVSHLLEEDIKKNKAIISVKPMPVISVNKPLISQLFVNLITNALKYHGDKQPEIEVGCNEEPGIWIFYVKDNGIGIDPNFFDKIFIIFKRLHNKDEYSGTGIGLAICKKIIEIHKGKIWVESEPGKGSTFYFSIPKIKQSA